MISSRFQLPALACLALLLAACAKAPEPPPPEVAAPSRTNLVKHEERSPHFEDVDKHLELGGVLYGYMDVDGDALDVARKTQNLAKQLAASVPQLSALNKQDLASLFTALGFDDIKAIGVSSVHEAGGLYRNRTFIYTPSGRSGLLAVFGGPPAPFTSAKMAPADADIFLEHEIDLKAVYDTVENIVTKADGPDAATSFRNSLQKLGSDASFSVFDFVTGLKGRATVIVRFDGDRTITLPAEAGGTGAVIPATSGLIRIDGIGPALERMVKAKPRDFQKTKDGDLRVYTHTRTPKIDGFQPVFAFQGSAFFLAWNEDFLSECLARSHGLDANPKFAAALKELGPEGNGLTWITPRMFDRLRDLATLNPNGPAAMHQVFEFYSASLPTVTEPMLSVRTNLSDGILIRSHWNRSLKADLALVTIYNPVTLGLLASMAVPAFQKSRQNAQAVAITANLASLYRATQAYCLAHQVDEVGYDDLVGPGQLLEGITAAAGEDYRSLTFRKGQPLVIRLADGRHFSFPARRTGATRNDNRPPTTPVLRQQYPAAPTSSRLSAQDRAVLENLHTLHDAAERYYEQNQTTTVTFEQLVGPGKLVPSITPVEGESYQSLLFKQGSPLHLHLQQGREVVFPEPGSE